MKVMHDNMSVKALMKSWVHLLLGSSDRPSSRESVVRLVDAYMAPIVQAGPFCGMAYDVPAFCSQRIPKLAGTYERELHAAVTEAASRGYSEVLNIGSADGYYAVGMLLANPGMQVIACDISEEARTSTGKLATDNGVADRLEVVGECTSDLIERMPKGSLVICDIEGNERYVLDPSKSPNLLNLDMVVEVHDGMQEGEISGILRARFSSTHDIEAVVFNGDRADALVVFPWWLPSRWRSVCLGEKRTYGMRWFVMRRIERSCNA